MKMKTMYSVTLILVIACFSMSSYAQIKTALSQPDQAKALVKSFYDDYLKKSGGSLETALKNQKASLSPELLQKLNEDVAASQKSPGEIVGLDFDPFLGGNDPGNQYVMGEIKKVKEGQYWVKMTGYYTGQPKPCCVVWVETTVDATKASISNVHYPDYGNIVENENLLSILKVLAKDRATPSAH